MLIYSLEENEVVWILVGGKNVFIGFNDNKIEGVFVWSDGSIVIYENWEDNEFNDGFNMSDCVILDGLLFCGKWNDILCIMWYKYVCKFIYV